MDDTSIEPEEIAPETRAAEGVAPETPQTAESPIVPETPVAPEPAVAPETPAAPETHFCSGHPFYSVDLPGRFGAA